MELEQFRQKVIELASALDPNYPNWNPAIPYYKYITVEGVADFVAENLPKIPNTPENLREKQFISAMLREPKKQDYFDVLVAEFKNTKDRSYLFGLTNDLEYYWDKSSFDDIIDLLNHPIDFLPESQTTPAGYTTHPRVMIRQLLFKPLGKTKDPRAKDILIDYLKKYPECATEILKGLKFFKDDPEIVKHVEPLLNSKFESARKAAAKFIKQVSNS